MTKPEKAAGMVHVGLGGDASASVTYTSIAALHAIQKVPGYHSLYCIILYLTIPGYNIISYNTLSGLTLNTFDTLYTLLFGHLHGSLHFIVI